MSNFELTLEARRDLRDLWLFIAKDNIDAADRVRDQIYAAFESLSEMPGKGRLREDLGHPSLRIWSVYHYLIIYRAETQPLEIVRVISGYRDIKNIHET